MADFPLPTGPDSQSIRGTLSLLLDAFTEGEADNEDKGLARQLRFGPNVDPSIVPVTVVCTPAGASFVPRDSTTHPVRVDAASAAEFTRLAWVNTPGNLAGRSSPPSSVDAISGIVEA